jgi:DNA-nicking Smr family endonuclease
MARRSGAKPPVDDASLFRQAMRDVEPLRRKPRAAAAAKKKPTPASAPASVRAAPPPPLPPPPSPPPAPPRSSGGVDRRTSVRLRRGQIRPEAKLDLHGMTQIEAHGALASFIRGARAAGTRCILVVTGKGSMATGGVLRREVPRWLDDPGVRGAILGIAEAHAKDGGAGALYVLLRKKSRE